ncbi:MAG: PEP-CTERM sorting domain-containing protein [Planctomycetales bacterium]|nr:PEP-CTERM sorting domain-containing protein [Planctomycetales bacterium]
MRLKTACLLGAFALLAAPAFADPIIDVQTMRVGPGVFTHWIYLNPNTGIDEIGFINTTVMSDPNRPNDSKIHQYLERINYSQVNVSSQQPIAEILDPTYPAELDTVFDDSAFPGVVEVNLTPLNSGLPFVPPPAPQPSNNGTRMMEVSAASFTGGLGGPLPGDAFVPIWHVTTWGPWLWISGTLQTDSNPNGYFEIHVPEPSTAILAGLGLALVGVARRRRK